MQATQTAALTAFLIAAVAAIMSVREIIRLYKEPLPDYVKSVVEQSEDQTACRRFASAGIHDCLSFLFVYSIVYCGKFSGSVWIYGSFGSNWTDCGSAVACFGALSSKAVYQTGGVKMTEKPDLFLFDQQVREEGFLTVCGVDEAGRTALWQDQWWQWQLFCRQGRPAGKMSASCRIK